MLNRLLLGAVLLLAAAARPAFAYDDLRVLDPNQTWRSSRGTIESAVLSVQPKGLYVEYGLYLTISARGSIFGPNELLEVVFNFDLPEDAIVHDSWLWVGDEIMQAQILDRWTASSIYENIVNRRRDPSLLVKQGPNQYELRIYPMRGNESRKVKLTYLMPASWTAAAVTSALPTNLLRTSATAPKLTVLAFLDPEWKNPQVLGTSGITFRPYFDPEFGYYVRADVPAAATAHALSLSLDAPLKNGIYLSRYDPGDEGLYQLVFLPTQALDAASTRRVAFLLDYDAANSSVGAQQLLDQVRTLLHTQLDENDAFNLIFSNLNIRRASETWIPADSARIEQTFAALGASPLASYSNLPALLGNGIDFVKANGPDGTLLLVSNADQVGDYLAANQLLNDVLRAASPPVPIHVVDFQDRNAQYQSIGGRAYYGNEYFYTNLARLTAGNYAHIRSKPVLAELLHGVFQSMEGLITSFDLHTTLANGFCFARQTRGAGDGLTAQVSGAVMQVGKFRGSFPFVLQASGLYRGAPFSRTIEVRASEAFHGDTLSRTIWAGTYIRGLEREVQSNSVVSEIIDLSVRERILSLYTAFLALEPSDTVAACSKCTDESQLVGTEPGDELPAGADSLKIEAYPNPFHDRTTIEVTLPPAGGAAGVTVAVYDLLGRPVRTFAPAPAPGDRTLRLTWDGTSTAGEPVASGVYLCVVTTPTGRQTLKLVRVR